MKSPALKVGHIVGYGFVVQLGKSETRFSYKQMQRLTNVCAPKLQTYERIKRQVEARVGVKL